MKGGEKHTPILPYNSPLTDDDPFSAGFALLECKTVGISKVSNINSCRSIQKVGFRIPVVLPQSMTDVF
jgi:hypothetical protein